MINTRCWQCFSLYKILHLLHKTPQASQNRGWEWSNLTNSLLITDSDSFVTELNHTESLLSTMSYVLCDVSLTTRSLQEGRGLEKDCSDFAGKRTIEPSLLQSASRGCSPFTLSAGRWRRQTVAAAPIQLSANQLIKMEIQVQVKRQYEDQPLSYLKPWAMSRWICLFFFLQLETGVKLSDYCSAIVKFFRHRLGRHSFGIRTFCFDHLIIKNMYWFAP